LPFENIKSGGFADLQNYNLNIKYPDSAKHLSFHRCKSLRKTLKSVISRKKRTLQRYGMRVRRIS